ncbi:PREDICTED: 60S ribosomal protein L35a-like [Amphimedon queenslandica]|uniref:Large ribosomal subunit protein eL33 n=1 Tax=Amphimedon queenslandica TaxID=400682 RepID=A0A1X7U4N8_AMPQE|nr:PREDICTED: 60S ribosomal protein L35a-like [Amphimedon queenslandica]XP_011406044.1 PREDICTED: 60S ribosomal protein L35a-like [Amphimedon queenslandica]|eukprot:XP_003388997.1 PREDICTED: 60S ribosomal protein L35a-like [Amphimedon queenslandica]
MTRLYCKGVFLSYRRGKRNLHTQQSLIKIEGVESKPETEFYFGKRVAYVYKVQKRGKARGDKKPSKHRVIWGRVMKSHGNNGVVRAKFRKNLPARALGARVRVMLYPSRV